MAHRQGSTDMAYGGTFSGGVDEAGREFHHCAVAAGFNSGNCLHAVGDGAPWIADQIKEYFGAKRHYLVDFYHVCDYLAAAVTVCSATPKVWIEQQKEALKSSQVSIVLAALLPYIEPAAMEDKDAPVRRAHRYPHNRRKQLDYKGAIEKKLPIGSGEIESAHRYIVQQRLKRPGTWWTLDNVDYMLALRLARANRRWNEYWKRGEKKISPREPAHNFESHPAYIASCLSDDKTLIIGKVINFGGRRLLAAVFIYGNQTLSAVFRLYAG